MRPRLLGKCESTTINSAKHHVDITPQDVYSYNVEQSKGHTGNNVVTVLMKDRQIGLQEACDYVGTYCRELMRCYLSARDELRATVSGDASLFIEAAGSWIIGNLEYVNTPFKLRGYGLTVFFS